MFGCRKLCLIFAYPRHSIHEVKAWLENNNVKGMRLVAIFYCVIMPIMATCTNGRCPAIKEGNGSSVPVILTNISTFHFELDYATEKPFTLCCCVRGLPKPNITWLKDNNPLPSIERIELKNDNQELRFERLIPVDSGYYTCIAKNTQGIRNYTVHMDIRAKPVSNPPELFLNDPWKAVVGSNITLVCQVISVSQMKPTVGWFKVNGSSLPTYLPSSPVIITEPEHKYVSRLTITNVKFKDAGTYKCQAKNGFAPQEKDGNLTVIERKDKTDPEVTPRVTTDIQVYRGLAIGGGLALVIAIVIVITVYIKRRNKRYENDQFHLVPRNEEV